MLLYTSSRVQKRFVLRRSGCHKTHQEWSKVTFVKGIAIPEGAFGSFVSCLVWGDYVLKKLDTWRWGSRTWTAEQRKPHMLCYLLELVYDLALNREVSKNYSEAVGFESPLGYYAHLGQVSREQEAMVELMEQRRIEQDESYAFQYDL